mmetsp:Transcript_95507/g.270119  ORF Transcript_95507/g.270119 Transcript_95507/m.270119 type:complete len:375 (+) Transcript_95507:1039-2163(+)
MPILDDARVKLRVPHSVAEHRSQRRHCPTGDAIDPQRSVHCGNGVVRDPLAPDRGVCEVPHVRTTKPLRDRRHHLLQLLGVLRGNLLNRAALEEILGKPIPQVAPPQRVDVGAAEPTTDLRPLKFQDALIGIPNGRFCVVVLGPQAKQRLRRRHGRQRVRRKGHWLFPDHRPLHGNMFVLVGRVPKIDHGPRSRCLAGTKLLQSLRSRSDFNRMGRTRFWTLAENQHQTVEAMLEKRHATTLRHASPGWKMPATVQQAKHEAVAQEMEHLQNRPQLQASPGRPLQPLAEAPLLPCSDPPRGEEPKHRHGARARRQNGPLHERMERKHRRRQPAFPSNEERPERAQQRRNTNSAGGPCHISALRANAPKSGGRQR